ncbi:MAG: hypothetical protein NZ942_01765 [Candidatus Aenigmarchaeota archaeon]|nr:hypothetical protein [Candidatus Aenigmarchaeota archaeon]
MIEIKLRYLVPVFTFLVLACVAKSQEAVSGSVTINATVGQAISISLSQELQAGIRFGQVSPGTNNNKAIGNSGQSTNYSIQVDSSSTSPVNFWHRAAGNLMSGNNFIGLGNLTHEANTTSDGSNLVGNDGQYQLTTTYTKIGGTPGPCDNTPPNSNCYLAFWLDVPLGIPSGVYSTTYYYCANATQGTASCD